MNFAICPEAENLAQGVESPKDASLMIKDKEHQSDQDECPSVPRTLGTTPATETPPKGKKPICSSHPGKVLKKVLKRCPRR
jgi:hypothetical protein